MSHPAPRSTTPVDRGKAFVAALAAINEATAIQPPHRGGYVRKNRVEPVWECDVDCPHPIHDDESIVSVARKCDPVGAVEIAARLGVSRKTVDQWRQRKVGFPEPRWQVGGRPAWNFDDIEGWYQARKAHDRSTPLAGDLAPATRFGIERVQPPDHKWWTGATPLIVDLGMTTV